MAGVEVKTDEIDFVDKLPKTRSGKIFRCVEIRDIINKHWPGSNNCVYKII